MSTANSIVQLMIAKNWFYLSVIVEDQLQNDGLLEKLNLLSSRTSLWTLDNTVRVSSNMSDEALKEELEHLYRNKTRVYLLHVSSTLALNVLYIAHKMQLVNFDTVWISTEEVLFNLTTMQLSTLKLSENLLIIKPIVFDELTEDLLRDMTSLALNSAEGDTANLGQLGRKEKGTSMCWHKATKTLIAGRHNLFK